MILSYLKPSDQEVTGVKLFSGLSTVFHHTVYVASFIEPRNLSWARKRRVRYWCA